MGGQKKIVFGGPSVKEASKALRKVKNYLSWNDVPTYHPEKRTFNEYHPYRKEARIRKEKARKVPILNQNFQPQKHPVKKDMALPGNLTIGIPVQLMIPQIQPQEELLHGME